MSLVNFTIHFFAMLFLLWRIVMGPQKKLAEVALALLWLGQLCIAFAPVSPDIESASTMFDILAFSTMIVMITLSNKRQPQQTINKRSGE